MLDVFGTRVRTTSPGDEAIQVTARTHSFGAIRLMQFRGNRLSGACEAADGAPEVLVIVMINGKLKLRRTDKELNIAPGSIGFVTLDSALEFSFETDFDFIAVGLPAQRLPAMRRARRDAGMIRIPETSDPASLFVRFTSALAQFHEQVSLRENIKSADTIVDLAQSALQSHVGERAWSQRDLHHRERIEKLVQRELRNSALDITFIASQVGLSVRHIHRLFSAADMSLTQWILEQRLDHCFRDLSQQSSVQRSIGEIAFSWGFNDQAHFSRAFRKRFGIPPSKLRTSRQDAA